ncbi:CAAX amino terminal protease self- immunity [Serratia grimesii]|uniref:CPBP family intramembrane glutamic endopeptidase n=1 Tax=Serratia grimesii TaxID=82995 RepID=UPI002177C2CA|nr:type II CAAX endopeptidase family protein [Serratia grimesii]CAI1588225.1 CAAX amino terminal protease self- immunity [Serratia grimesii]
MNNGSRKSSKLAFACFSMFLLMVGLTFYPMIIPDKVALLESGLLLPILYTIEFFIITPLYVIYFSKLDDMGLGHFSFRQFFVFIFLILLVQLAGAYILDIRKAENWMMEQESVKGGLFWLNFLLLVFIVPIYEELVFRGCLLTALITFSRGNIYIASLVTSVLFAMLHTQYTDIRSLIILFLVSIILISVRIISRGVMMPVLLHMTMNGCVMGLAYYFM